MISTAMIVRVLTVAALLASTRTAHADAADVAPCKYTQTDASLLLTASVRPVTRIVVDLRSNKGRAITITLDASPDAALVHELRLPGTPGDVWTISAAGDRAAFATADGKGSVAMAYIPASCASTKIELALSMLVVGLDKSSWVTVDAAPKVTLEIVPKATRLDRLGLADAALDAGGIVPSTRGLDSTIPDAVRETLTLLAEIAVDRAKAEGARLLKDRIQKYLCTGLTIDGVFRMAANGAQRLLPATCGQLENLRFSDLGASASGLVHALREDTIDVVVPALLDALPPSIPSATRLKTPVAKAAIRVAAMAVRRGFTPSSVRLAALGLLDVAALPPQLTQALRVAIQCTKQDCSLGDVRALMQEVTTDLLAAAHLPAALAPLVNFAATCAPNPAAAACGGANLKALVGALAMIDITQAPAPMRDAIALAVKCSQTTCSATDVTAFIEELAPLALARTSVPTKFQPILDQAVTCALTGCTATDLQTMVNNLANGLTATDLVTLPDSLRGALDVATRCAAAPASCGAADLRAFVAALQVVDPFWLNAAQRLITMLRPRADADGVKLGGELIDLLLDVVKHECPDRKCEILVTAMREITVGVVEADYLRALGGIQAALVATGFADRLVGKPFELAATIASYVSTYRETKDKDAAVARDLRKRALEGLIDAATDRTNRGGNWIVSLGASVGFSGGVRRFGSAPDGVNTLQSLKDVRLPLGISVQRIPEPDRALGWGCYGMLGIADLAQFVSSPVDRTTTPPGGAEMTTSLETEPTWSDFVAVELQLGVRFGSARVPLMVGIDAYYRPRARFEIDGATRSTSVLHLGGFIGFNVPFFDLN